MTAISLLPTFKPNSGWAALKRLRSAMLLQRDSMQYQFCVLPILILCNNA